MLEQFLFLSDAVDFLKTSLAKPYSVVTAQQACSTGMVKLKISSNFLLIRILSFAMHTAHPNVFRCAIVLSCGVEMNSALSICTVVRVRSAFHKHAYPWFDCV